MSNATRLTPTHSVALPANVASRDVEDALQYASSTYANDEPLVVVDIEPARRMSLAKVAEYDDVVGWLELEPGDLTERDFAEVAEYRGFAWARRALSWRDRAGRWHLPPLIVVDAGAWTALGDGRGRYNLAVWLGLRSVPVVVVRVRSVKKMRLR